MSEQTVYISYRRRFSQALALALFHALRAAGCDAYLNVNPTDERDAVDLAQIEARSHFLVIVTPGLVDALQRPDDPMHCEIDRAVKTRRAIVPLLANGFTFGATAAREINVLRRSYALPLEPDSLAACVQTLVEQRLNTRIFGLLTPTPPEHDAAVIQRLDAALSLPTPAQSELCAELIFNRALGRNRLDYAAKLADYDEALRLNPNHVYARFDRALTRRRSGDEAGAVADYDEVLRLSPEFYKAYNNRAELYFAHGAYAQALADYERATNLFPKYTMSLTGKALTLHALGRVDEALALWRPLAAQDQRFYDAMWVGRELRLPSAMIDEIHRLAQYFQPPLRALHHAPGD